MAEAKQPPKTPREMLASTPTPTDVMGIFALFLAVEADAMDRGVHTADEAREAIKAVFTPQRPVQTEPTPPAPQSPKPFQP